MNFLDKFIGKKRVFLDYASSTPVLEEVEQEMAKYKSATFYNPSALYSEALSAKEALSISRNKIANLISAQKNNIVFTSGGTEGNNLAILGVFEAHKKDNFIPHFITTSIEHPAVLEVFKEIEKRGGEVTIVPVDVDGIVISKDIKDSIKENTVLVSVMYANNEIGTVQPINEIAKTIRDWRKNKNTKLPYLHTDACQAPSYLDMNVLRLGVDLMTVDGIKIYGPRGIGFLYVREDVSISPIVFGGGQENGLRSGTENISGIVGLSKALEVVVKDREKESKRLEELWHYAVDNILDSFPTATLNGHHKNRLPNNINICFPGLDAEFAVIALDVLGVSASYSSSCRTLKEDSSSYVISNMGKEECSMSSLRFTMGRGTKISDIDFLLKALKKVVK
jgi:cysteine desulfurase